MNSVMDMADPNFLQISRKGWSENPSIGARTRLPLIGIDPILKKGFSKNVWMESPGYFRYLFTASAIAIKCDGDVPQQPPMIFAPDSTQDSTWLAIISGVTS